MNDFDSIDDSDDCEPTPIQVDIYGCKVPLRPRPVDNNSARITAASLADDVKQSLLRICRDSIGFVADVFTGARSIVRGVAALPNALASRISRAHRLSENREIHAEEQNVQCPVTLEAKTKSIEALDDLLSKLNAKGIAVRTALLPQGQVLISVVRPEFEDASTEIALDAIQELNEESARLIPVGVASEVLQDSAPLSELNLNRRILKMLSSAGINTLGKLSQTTADDLLTLKGFGEASLDDVRNLLRNYGRRLSVAQDKSAVEKGESVEEMLATLSDSQRKKLSDPISDLQLSIRSRKAMVRLGLATIGELICRTPNDLLEAKNFGVHALEEVRSRLRERGLRLRTDT